MDDKKIEEWYKIPMFEEKCFEIYYKDSFDEDSFYYIYVTRIPTGWLVSKDYRTNSPCFVPFNK